MDPPAFDSAPKTERPFVRENPNNQPKKTPVKDRYHYDRYGNYKGRSSSEGPGVEGLGGLLWLLILLPALPELLFLGLILFVGFVVFSWLVD